MSSRYNESNKKWIKIRIIWLNHCRIWVEKLHRVNLDSKLKEIKLITLRFQTMNFDATFGIVPSCFSQAFAVSIYLTIKCMLGIHKVE